MTQHVSVHAQASAFDARRSTTVEAWRPGLTVGELTPSEFKVRDLSEMVVAVNAAPASSLLQFVSPGDHVTFARRQADPVTATVAVKFLGATVFHAPAWLGAVAAAVGNMAIAYVVGRLIAPPPKPQTRDGQESPTYQFTGIRANRAEGLPIPLVYGQMRFAGTVISEYLDFTIFQAETTYNGLILLGHGPIGSIGGKGNDSVAPLVGSQLPGGMEIDSNDAQNFSGVKVEVRMGSLEQTPVTQFQEIPTNYPETAFELLVTTDPAANPNTSEILTGTTYSVKADSDAHFAAWGESQSMTEDADRATVQVTFPNGLMRIDGSGSIQLHTARFVARYVELDGTATPITTGGPESDGYVRLPPLQPIIANKSGTFTATLPIPLYDPQTYAHSVVGEASIHPSTTAFLTRANPTTPGWTATETMDYTVMGWVGFAPGDLWPGGVGAGTDHFPLFELFNGNRGVKLGVSRGQAPIFAGSGTHWYVQVNHGDGTAFSNEVAIGGISIIKAALASASPAATVAPPAIGWRHIAARYRSDENKWAIYINGELADTQLATRIPTAPVVSGSTLRFRGIGTACPGFKLDEFRMFSRALTDGEIASDYNSGSGTYGIAGDTTLQGGFHLGGLNDYSANGNTLTASGGQAFTAGGGGIIFTTGAGTVGKRSQYKVELARNSLDGTHERIFDTAVWTGLTTFIDDALSYPGFALAAVRVTASEQLSGNVPDISFRMKGRKLPVWDGNAIEEKWSANPAWVALDVITNKDYGLGHNYGMEDVQLDTFLEWGNYCDELLDSKRHKITVGTGSTNVNLFYGQDPTTFEWIIALTNNTTTENMTVDQYSRLGKPRVGDFIAFSGVPIAATASPANTTVNTVDGAESYTPGTDPSIGGGLEVIRSEQVSAGQWKLYCRWPGGNTTYPWTQNSWLSTHATLAGTVRRQERRFACNGVIDTPGSAWDRLVMICAVGRAAPIRVGNTIRVKFDGPRSPVDLVSQASIVAGSFELEYTGPTEKPNVMELEILDASLDWDRTIVLAEHPSVQDPSTFEGYRVDSQFLWGVTSQAQAKRFGMWQLNLYNLIRRQGRFTLGPDGLAYEPGDVVVLSHDLLHGSTSGRVQAASETTSTVTLDTDVTLSAAGTWEVQVRDSSDGTYSVGIIDTATHVPPLTIAAGTPITLSTPLAFVADVDDPFVFTLAGADLLAQITSCSLATNLERQIEWMEYNEAVFDDNSFDDLLAQTFTDQPGFSDRTIPLGPASISGPRFIAATGAGGDSPEAVLSWRHHADTLHAVARTQIFYRRVIPPGEVDRWPIASSWHLLATVEGAADSWRGSVPGREGERMEFAARPVNAAGRGYAISSASAGQTEYRPAVVRPDAPLSVSADMAGERVTYSVTPQESREGVGRRLMAVVRRGGWILGQDVCALPWGVTTHGPTMDWAGGDANSRGESDPTLYAAYVAANGVRSGLVSTVLDADAGGLPLAHYAAGVYSWEDYGTGWSGGAFVPDVTLTDCQATADWTGRKYLEFAGSALTASYETALGPALKGMRDRECYCEAFAVAEHVSPAPMELAFPYGAGAPESDHWTIEGSTLESAARCTLSLSISTDNGVTWAAYKPGKYVGKLFRFRINLTRPSADFNVRVWRFSTRVTRVPFSNPAGRRSDVTAMLHAELFSG